MVPLCQYILQDDKQCEQAAIKGGHYCRHHQVIRKSIAASEAEGEDTHTPLPFAFPENYAAQLHNYFMVLHALNEGRLNIRMVNVMIRLLKACDASLKQMARNTEESSELDSDNEQTSTDSEQVPEVDASERTEIAAARERRHERKEPTSVAAREMREPLALLQHSRGIAGRGRRRR